MEPISSGAADFSKINITINGRCNRGLAINKITPNYLMFLQAQDNLSYGVNVLASEGVTLGPCQN